MIPNKSWIISYSIKTTDGVVWEDDTTVEAPTITAAIEKAQGMIAGIMNEDEKNLAYVIWDIGIVEDEVF